MPSDKIKISILAILTVSIAHAELAVSIAPVQVVANKAVVKVTMKNNLSEPVTSARAALFLMDNKGKVVGQSVGWVVGGRTNSPELEIGATNTFNFVITSPRLVSATNLVPKVQFNRVSLGNGAPVDIPKDVQIHYLAAKQ